MHMELNSVKSIFFISHRMRRTKSRKTRINATAVEEVTDTNSAFFDTAHGFSGCIAGLHEILRRHGLMQNINCLNLNETLSPGQAEELDRVQMMYPRLNDDEFVRSNIEKWK